MTCVYDDMTKVITLKEAAAVAGVTRRTLTRWIAAGHLRPVAVPGVRHHYVTEWDVLECERDRHLASRRGRPGARLRVDMLT